MALTYSYIGDYDLALRLLQEARRSWEQLGIKFEWVNTYFAEAQLEFQRGNRDLARKMLTQTFDKAYSLLEDTPARERFLALIQNFIDKYF